MKNFFLLSFILLSFYTASAQSGWTQVADLAGQGRARAATFSIQGKGYLVGGGNSWYLTDAWAYDTASNAWSQVANYPDNHTDGMAGFAIDTFGYVGLGGYAGYTYSNSFYRYNAAANSWIPVANFPGAARVDGVAFVVNGFAYIGAGINGTNNNMLSDFYSYDAYTNTWSQISSYPGAGHFFLAAFSTTGKGYVGTGAKLGVSANSVIPVQDFWEYDPTMGAGGTWTKKADFPNPRGGAIGVSFGNNGYIGTGFTDSTTTNLSADFWKYSPATNSWRRIADLTSGARSFGAGFSFNSSAYAGTGNAGSNFYLDFWKLQDVKSSGFTASQTSVCAGSSITFTDTSNFNPTHWEWSFPGGTPNSSTVSNPIITYDTAGVYDVTEVAWNNSDSAIHTSVGYITVNSNAPLNVSANPQVVCSGQSASLSINGGNGNYSWSPATGLNDSTSSTVTATPTVTTTYTVNSSNGGCSSAGSVVVLVGNNSIGGHLTATGDTVCMNTGTQLALLGHNGSPIQWQSSNDDISYTSISSDTGIFYNTVPLQQTTWYRAIVGSGACAATSDTLEVFVEPQLSAYFLAQVNGLQVAFIASGNPNRYNWSFGDGSSSTSGSPVHTYSSAGAYNVCLTVVGNDINRCLSTSCQEVVVGGNNHCSAYFVLRADSTTPHHWFAINETNGLAPITYNWQWGDGTSGTGDTASHVYTSAGFYNICLTITDDSACTSTYCDSSAYLFRMDGNNTMVSVNVVNSKATGTQTVNAPLNNLLVLPNPCTTCEVKGIDNVNYMIATDMLGRKVDVLFSKEGGGYSITFSTNQSGMFLLHNIKTGQVVKFVKLN